MKRKWLLLLFLGVVGAAMYGGIALGTPATVPGFKGTTLANARFGEIFSHVHTVPASWDELIQTKGESDLYVQQNTWDPNACGGCTPSTGWHTHPGPSLVIVTQGTVTEYDGDDPSCTPHVYSASGSNAFVDIGGGAVHLIRNESGAPAQTIAVQLIPAGAVRRQDESDPGNCSF